MCAKTLGDEQKVVVPAIDAASSVACLRSLGNRGIQPVAISEQDHPPGFQSTYCDEALRVVDPAVNMAGYEKTLLTLAHRDDIQTIIPVREADTYVLARQKEELSEQVATPWPELAKLARVQDRVQLFTAAKAANVPIPKTATLDEWTEWESDVIVKPRYTMHAPEYSSEFTDKRPQHQSTQYIPADDDVDHASLSSEMGHVPLVQEYIPDSDEYAFFALYQDGEPVATFQHRQRRAWKYAGGPSAYREAVDIPALDTAGRQLLNHLDWHGLAMVEFLRDPATGEFKLMEVNPRFWTSLPFTVQAGVDFPYLYWKQATDRPIRSEPDYEVGMAGHLLRGELLHLHSILCDEYPVVNRPSFEEAMFDIVLSLVRHPHFDYLARDDPRPFLQDSRNLLSQAITTVTPPSQLTGKAEVFSEAVSTGFERASIKQIFERL